LHRGMNLVFELDPKLTPRMTKQMDCERWVAHLNLLVTSRGE
jgi:hypothetical protein